MKIYLVRAEYYAEYEPIFYAQCFLANSTAEAIEIACNEFGTNKEDTWAEEICFDNYKIKLEEWK